MSEQDRRKAEAAQAALEYIKPKLNDNTVIGVGTGSTVNYFIDGLADIKHLFAGAVSSSESSSDRLRAHGIRIEDSNASGPLDLYIDGADEANEHLELIKGGGAALTREKIVAASAREFICIVDDSKLVPVLGEFPLPVEVIPMARSLVAREIVSLGGRPIFREGVVTDNGNVILDLFNFSIPNPIEMEKTLNNIAGVVCNGIFALRPADVLVIASSNGVKLQTRR